MYKVICFKQENMPDVYVVMGQDKYGDWNEIDGRSRYSTKQSAYRRCRSLNAQRVCLNCCKPYEDADGCMLCDACVAKNRHMTNLLGK